MKRHFQLLTMLALAASCAQPAPTAAPIAPCQALPGAEALLAAPAARLIVIGADAAPEAAALLLTACAALERGERVAALLPADAQWDDARAALTAWAAQGARVVVAALPSVAADSRPLTQSDLAAALAVAADAAQADRAVALVDAESAARRPLGLSGQTWSPAGALLPADTAVTLRAMESAAPEPRLSLGAFEDVTPVGAARAYDGLITLPTLPETDATPPEQDLRGR
jgi:hypothetical protein